MNKTPVQLASEKYHVRELLDRAIERLYEKTKAGSTAMLTDDERRWFAVLLEMIYSEIYDPHTNKPRSEFETRLM